MPSGGHRHLKRLAAINAWGLEKTGGKYAVRPMPGAHNKEMSIPIYYILSKYLKLASTRKEVNFITKKNMINVNGKPMRNPKSTVGLFDVITINKTNEHYRLLFSVNRKFKLQKISSSEAQFRLTKVSKVEKEDNIPIIRTLDGFNFRFCNPEIEINDTVKIDINSNKVVSHHKFVAGAAVFIFSGSNQGRVGVIKRMEHQKDGQTSIYLEDANGKLFSVLMSRSIVIGNGSDLLISLDESKGIKLTAFELSNLRYKDTVSVQEE